jgi:hypothetical protein
MSGWNYEKLVRNLGSCEQPRKELSDVEIAMLMSSLGG